jgi:hypothetical protein
MTMSEQDIKDIIDWLKRIDIKIDKIRNDVADIKNDNNAIDKRTIINENDIKDITIAIAKANTARLSCRELEDDKIKLIAEDIKAIKKTVGPVKEATTIFLWLKKHWIISAIIAVILISSLIGLVSIFSHWPIGKNISNMTLGDIWNTVSIFKK